MVEVEATEYGIEGTDVRRVEHGGVKIGGEGVQSFHLKVST